MLLNILATKIDSIVWDYILAGLVILYCTFGVLWVRWFKPRK